MSITFPLWLRSNQGRIITWKYLQTPIDLCHSLLNAKRGRIYSYVLFSGELWLLENKVAAGGGGLFSGSSNFV